MKLTQLKGNEPAADAGHLAENVMHFTRVLRAAGLPIGPDRVIDAVRALDVSDIGRRDDFYWTLASVLIDRREKVVVGLNATGQVREFQLRTRFRFKLRTPQGKELIPETEMLQQRDISFTESAALAKEAEETLLYRDMQTDIVQQLMRRLAAVKTL